MRRAAGSAALLAATALCLAGCAGGGSVRADGEAAGPSPQTRPAAAAERPPLPEEGEGIATLAGGCFWCVEAAFDGRPGVIEAVSGYTGGEEVDPTYGEVSSGRTGHYEAVQVRFDPSKISYEEVLDTFWRQIDPTDGGGQFADRGSQYRPAVFVHDEAQRRAAEGSRRFLEESGWFDRPIATEILPAAPFYAAEEYHQDYHLKNAAHYKLYKQGSGRGPFLERFWKGKPPIAAAADKEVRVTTRSKREYRKPDDAALRERLTPMQYRVTQHEGTEPPFRNEFWDNHEPGIYVDVVTGEPLFSSTDKFDSGTGWPSFVRPLDPENIVERTDRSLGMIRTEVRSRHGDSHLGHLFDDGPAPTGQRYCINSAALRFIPAASLEAEGYDEYRRLFAEGARDR